MKKIILLVLAIPFLFLLTACDEDTFTVTFVDHDGTVLYEVVPDGDVVPPEDPLREGYVFDGWYTDSEYLDLYDEFDYDDVLAADLTLYVKWTPAVYTVTVHFGTGIESQEILYNYGETIEITNPPEKKGYTVGSVYVNEANTVEFDPEFSPTQDFDVYVSWVPKTVTINYYEDVPFEVDFFSIGAYSTHIVTMSGELFAWGTNINRTFGSSEIAENSEYMEPVNITDSFNFEENEVIVQLSRNTHILALTNQHRVFGWGNSEAFQLGVAQGAAVADPIDLTNGLPLEENDYVVSVSAGSRHSVFLTNEGRLIVIGDGDYGQLGYEQSGNPLGEFIDVTDLVALLENETIVEAYAYDESTLIYTNQDRVLVVGRNMFGELGTGDFDDVSTFTDITANFNLGEDETIVDFQFGFYFVLALTDTGKLYSFGFNEDGQLGIGTYDNTNVPTIVVQYGAVEAFANGFNAAYIDDQGNLYTWGVIPSELNWSEGIDEQRPLPEMQFYSDFGENNVLSDFNLGYGLFWFLVDDEFYIGEGRADFGQLLSSYGGSNLNDHFEAQSFVIVHTEEATYGEYYELYFPEEQIELELTQWYTEPERIHRYFGDSNLTYEELNLYGVWETRTYMLTIYENNEKQGYIRAMEYENPLGLNAYKSGFNLEGWYLDEALTIPLDFDVMPNYDVTVYAKWTEVIPEPLTVPFDGILTSEYSEVLYEFTLEYNQHFLLYADFEYGYFITLLDSDRNPIDDTDNFYAEYIYELDNALIFSELLEAGTYYIQIVQSNYNMGTYLDARIVLLDYFVPTYHTLEIIYGEAADPLAENILSGTILRDFDFPQISMFEFGGFYLDQEYTIPFTLDYMPNEDVTIYAKYIPKEIIELTFDQEFYDGYLWQEEQDFYIFTLTETTTVEIYTISNMDTYGVLYDENMEIIRSNDDYNSLDFGMVIQLPAGTYTLEVRGLTSYESGEYVLVFTNDAFVPEAYTVTFETNGGALIDPIEYFSGDYIEFPMTFKEGYLLKTWYQDPELTIEFDWQMPSSDITLYASWVETTALDVTTLPITVNDTFIDQEIIGYTFLLGESKTLQFDVTILEADIVFFVFTSEMDNIELMFIDAPETGTLTLTLDVGDYIIVFAGGVGNFDFSITEVT